VEAGEKLRVSWRKPGYVIGDGAGEGLVDVQSATAHELNLRMVRAASINGTVKDSANHDIDYAQVEVIDPFSGASLAKVRSDDTGTYRLHTLRAGSYLVKLSIGKSEFAPIGSPGAKGVVVFYPGVPERSMAKAISVSAGEDVGGIAFVVQLEPGEAVDATESRAVSSRTRPVGSGTIAGRIMTTVGEGVSDCFAVIWSPKLDSEVLGPCDANGRFSFRQLPSDDYTLSAHAPGFLSSDFGQVLVTEPGIAIRLNDGEEFLRADLALTKAGAVEGQVFDEFGDPAPGVTVRAVHVRYVGGERRFVNAPTGVSVRPTNDQGRFRIAGLGPGTYYLVALAGAYVDEGPFGFAPTFFPSTTASALARSVSVTAGTTSGGNIISLHSSPSASISGRLLTPSGRPSESSPVILLPLAADGIRLPAAARRTTGLGGEFEFSGVPSGSYVLQAGSAEDASHFVARRTTVTDTVGWRGDLTLVEGRRIEGRIVFVYGEPPVPDRVRISVRPTDFVEGPITGRGLAATWPRDDWTFELGGLHGQGVISVSAPPPWIIDHISLDGRDMTDAPIDFRQGDVTRLEIALTQRSATVSGRVLEGTAPISNVSVVVFSEDSAKWRFPSREVTHTRTGHDGSYEIQGLPEGRYLVIAVPAIAGAEWQDPALLSRLRSRAIPVALLGPQRSVVNLTLIR
jgi:hypothetical protein